MAAFRGEKAFLSNFYLCKILYDGYWYESVEHAFVAAKTLDFKEREHVRSFEKPNRAKKYGKTVSLRPDWKDVRVNIMKELVLQKFVLHKELGDKLLTIQGDIVELNKWHDYFWGVCGGQGENWLGKILMRTRDKLKEIRK